MFHSRLIVRLWILSSYFSVLLGGGRIFAEEPASRFIERLREERLFDHASNYLDIYGKKGWLPDSMKQDASLERLMIIQDSLAVSRTSKERDERLAALENGYRDFLASNKDHPRRSEAGLRFGNLLLDRGQRALKSIEDPNQKEEIEANRKGCTVLRPFFKGLQFSFL